MLSTMEKVRVLRAMDLFAEVPVEELAGIAYLAHEIAFAPGVRFITQGDPGDAVYIVVSGAVEIVVAGLGPVARRVAPTILGEMALFTRNPRTAHCVTSSAITALRIAQDDFRLLLAAKPGLAYGIIRVLATRLEELTAGPTLASPSP